MNAYKKLINNSFTFAIGNLGSKIISIILVPVYTYYLSTAEYGTVDIVTTTVTMLLPIVSGSIFDAVLRFIMESKEKESEILTNAIVLSTIGILVSLCFYPILVMFNVATEYLPLVYLILIVQVFEKILNQYTRAVGKIKVYALNGILLTLTTGIYNILFLVVFEMDVRGYFYATILAFITAIVFLLIKSNAIQYISLSKYNKEISIEMLRYSIPLVPNSVAWWLINTSSRYFILFFVGVSANGLFAVASRIPALVNIINQIFTQAWQLSAIEEFDNKNKSIFYSDVFKYLSTFLFVGTSGIIVVLKITFQYLFAEEYYSAWIVVPYLLLGTVFSSFAGFVGTNYIAAKQSKGVLKTSIDSGIISTTLNLLLIPLIGIVGAGLSSMISFFALFIIRYYDTKKYITIKINWKLLYLNIVFILIQILVLNFGINIILELIIGLIIFACIVFINKEAFIVIFKAIKK